MTEHQDPFHTFDWYFTDASTGDAARLHALNDKPRETDTLMNLVNADSIVHFALWSELPENHPVGELWLETQTDLLATIYLAYGGFFRQAFTILRAWFELAVHAVFFSAHYGQPSGRYEQWRRGQRNAPAKMLELAESLASRADQVIPTDKATIFNRLDPVYSFLSLHTHSQGLDIFNLQEGRDNVPRYLSKSFDLWYEEVLEAFNAACFLYRIFFPREIASYLRKSKPEMERANELAAILSRLVPDFGDLIAEAVALAM